MNNGPRFTEERLRYHLDGNQPQRERMCLALLPLLGPYTGVQPRRPKGGPDGGRDIEALYQGTMQVWGAVGFRNGGGVDETARQAAEEKFRADLDRALAENPSLEGFVFFTNVDLTPGQKEDLKKYAQSKNIKMVDVFDIERLRYLLDSPEGLIARLQYLDIPMSATEQAALVAKFGNELQNAVTARFDRVERTLLQMQTFLDFQKPLLRLDIHVELNQPYTSAEIQEEAIYLRVHGLQDLSKAVSCLAVNLAPHPNANASLVLGTQLWLEEEPSSIVSFHPSIGLSNSVMSSYSELSLSTSGNRVKIADLTVIGLEAFCTEGLASKIRQVCVDVNGYEFFCCMTEIQGEASIVKDWPEKLKYPIAEHRWIRIVKRENRNLLFDPPRPSQRRFLPLKLI
jgi:hypothetical protein